MRRFIWLTVCLVVLCVTTMAFAESPKYGGIWKDALRQNPPYLDPAMATDTTSAEVDYQIFETLVENDSEGNLVPLLAESWEMNGDATAVVFKLRRGVKFHKTTEGGQLTANGGREVTADDWVWTFNYICAPETNSPRAYFVEFIKGYEEYRAGKTETLAGVKALDDYTLKFELSEKFAPFASVLAYNTFVVFPKEDVLKWGDEWNFHPVGTGPFKFELWNQDDKIILSKNEEYWGQDENGNPLPYLDGIEFRIIEDYAVMWEEFKVGNLYQTFTDDPYYLEAKTKYRDSFYELPQLGTFYFGMNQELPPFKDNKPLRHAMNYAINRDLLNEIVLNGRQTPAKGILPPSMFGYNRNLTGYNYDPEKAKQLLKEAGYPNGLEITLQYDTNTFYARIVEALQAQYAQIGIKVNLKNIDWGTHLDTTARGEVPLFRMGWVCDYNDPDNFLYVLLNSENKGPRGNYTRYHNPIVDMLTKRARRESDPEIRKQLYQEAEEIIVDDAPMVFIFHYTTDSLVQPFVRGYVLPAFGQYSNKFTKVWLDL